MTENQDETTPTGTDEAGETDLGQPTEADPGAAAESLGEPRPDHDERQERLASIRKPMGPESDMPESHDDEDGAETPAPSHEGPTDPPDEEG